jgi:hypothetical protein
VIGVAPVRLGSERRADWTPLEADLSAYAGQRVTLRLELIPDKPLARDFLAWWGSPRIALRPG